MTKFKNLLIGLAVILIGVIIGLNAFGITDIELFFDGWWTLFIIVPCIIGLFDKGKKTGDIIGIIIGIALLLGCQNVLDFGLILKLCLPAILIIVGISIIFKGHFQKKISEKIEKLKKNNKTKNDYCAVFAGQNVNFSNEVFDGANLSCAFGGIKCDLRGAIITEDVLINADAVFGGIDIFPPASIKVKVRSSSMFGGVTNKAVFTGDDSSPCIYVNANCIFGGVEIK